MCGTETACACFASRGPRRSTRCGTPMLRYTPPPVSSCPMSRSNLIRCARDVLLVCYAMSGAGVDCAALCYAVSRTELV
eukprot:214460-Rhodomonas_salina.2